MVVDSMCGSKSSGVVLTSACWGGLAIPSHFTNGSGRRAQQAADVRVEPGQGRRAGLEQFDIVERGCAGVPEDPPEAILQGVVAALDLVPRAQAERSHPLR